MSSARDYYRVAAITCAVVTLDMGFIAWRIPWRARVDFDVLGIGWLLMNVPGLAVSALAFLFAVLTLYCVGRMFLSQR